MSDRSTRAIETKKQGLQAEEKKLIAEMAAVKVMAKDLIRTRYQITKFYALKSQLQGVSLKIQFIWDSFSKTGFGYKRPELDMVDCLCSTLQADDTMEEDEEDKKKQT